MLYYAIKLAAEIVTKSYVCSLGYVAYLPDNVGTCCWVIKSIQCFIAYELQFGPSVFISLFVIFHVIYLHSSIFMYVSIN